MIKGRDHLWHEPFDDDQIAKIKRKPRTSQISIAIDLAETAQQRRPQNRRSDPHLIDTPKHFAAMAASKKTAAFGKVSSDTAWNDACRPCVFAAHKESKYSPNDATDPDSTQVIIPGIIPLEAIAY